MFLEQLNDNEKKAFLRLSVLIASSDGNASEEEVSLIDRYADECGYSYYASNSDGRSIDEVLVSLSDASDMAKKIILLELTALVLSDDEYKEEEKKMIEKIRESFSQDEMTVNNFRQWTEKINRLYAEAAKMIGLSANT